jgi:hypothetical protein
MLDRHKKWIFLATLTLLLPALQQPSRAFTKKGTTAADFLKIGVGARSVAMGGAVTGTPEGLDALYWNPAGLAGSDKRLFGGTHAAWIASISHDFLAISAPIHRTMTVGVFAITLGTDEMEQTTILNPEGTGIYFDYSELALGAGLGAQLTDRFRIGGVVKVIHTRTFNEQATAFAIDVGTHLVTTLNGLSIGMAVANFGNNMKLDGSDLIVEGDQEPGINGNDLREARLETNEYPLPLTFRLGLAMDLIGVDPAVWLSQDHRITIALAGDHFAENVEQLHAGVEYGFRRFFFLRGGYTFGDDSRTWAAGAGLAFSAGGVGVHADFAYESMGVFDLVPRIGLALEF